ncbi:MAG: response regulator transcription factor [Verrucomicrobiota bacterium]
MRLLIVEDAPRLRGTLGTSLTHLGHAVDLAADGPAGDLLLTENTYDAVVLDIMLPGIDGLTLLSRMRLRGDSTPVLLLTARDAIEDRVRGLGSGADDYLVKPFALAELVARLEVLHRRRHGLSHALLKVGPLEIDTTAKTVSCHGAPVTLTSREYALLEMLALRPRQILTREQIENHLYADGSSPVSNAVDSAVCQLRRKLTPPGTRNLIQTRRGLGYTLDPG